MFIVPLDDWADARVDRLKREMFPTGCSPKTIPDGVLPAPGAGGEAGGGACRAGAGLRPGGAA
ncbi:MAG: hypothetical protein VKQ33_01435 [Candidatus Sericytochromatia bacterium]|nr:hypothetical protein [Candidatus Sericytochromatia bacterium]